MLNVRRSIDWTIFLSFFKFGGCIHVALHEVPELVDRHVAVPVHVHFREDSPLGPSSIDVVHVVTIRSSASLVEV